MKNPKNQDGIGEKELLVVSFGTADEEALAEDLGGIEDALQQAYPDYAVRRAFTSKLSIRRIEERDGVLVDDLDRALKRAVANGVKELAVVPTHLVRAEKYEDVEKGVRDCASCFDKISISEPLLGDTFGAERADSGEQNLRGEPSQLGEQSEAEVEEEFVAPRLNEKALKVMIALTADAVERAGYDNLRMAATDGIAFIFVGHGTPHTAGETYMQLQEQIEWLGYDNVFIGTVQGEPEETECWTVMREVLMAGYKKVILRPLLVTVGKHAREDIAGRGEDSWLSQFVESEAFEGVSAQTVGIGRVKAIQDIYVSGVK